MDTGKTVHTLSVHFALFVFAVLLFAAGQVTAQQAMKVDEIDAVTIDNEAKGKVIDSIFTAINDIYVFPDVAAEMEKHVRSRYKDGAYKDKESVMAFCRAVTEDLQHISKDRHLHVDFLSPREIEDFFREEPTEEERERMRQQRLAQAARSNFGWKEIKIMPGNIGYVKLDGFNDASIGGATAVAAMNFLANTDAIIFDLRQNGGGSPSMIQLITSYLLEEPTHLNSFYIRKEDTTQQFWTASHVEGPRMTDVDVYVVTSNYTFSAAEEFTYNLKNLKRATIVGETTGGGAHPVEHHVFPGFNVQMSLPFGRAINPITGTNWEGTGVTPDVEASAPAALDRAYLEALRGLQEKVEDGPRAFSLDWAIAGLEAKFNPVEVSSEKLATYVGQYEDRKITMRDGQLLYQRAQNPPMVMTPLSEKLFMFDDIDYFRLEVVTDPTGRPEKLVGHYDNGRTDQSLRTDSTM